MAYSTTFGNIQIERTNTLRNGVPALASVIDKTNPRSNLTITTQPSLEDDFFDSGASSTTMSHDSDDDQSRSSTPDTPTSPSYRTSTSPEPRYAIPVVSCPRDMYIAVLNRPTELKDLFNDNRYLMGSIRVALGQEEWLKTYKMWTEVDREALTDLELLRRSKHAFDEAGAGSRLWNQFCDIIGYHQKHDLSWNNHYLGGSRASPSLSPRKLDVISEDE